MGAILDPCVPRKQRSNLSDIHASEHSPATLAFVKCSADDGSAFVSINVYFAGPAGLYPCGPKITLVLDNATERVGLSKSTTLAS